ncbi:MAG TPA: Jag N-terminal domain-containing protein, partial [Thermomicrobiales bacterium]|nr:Jag N-terminal domain-containing protein [Thermomicrobiales bacterium]
MDRTRMTSVEIQAYSVEEAVRLALEQLGLTEDAVDIEVLSDAGPDEDAEALVRVTAKGMASQPTPSASGTRRAPGPRRVPGDRPSQRGTPPAPRPSDLPSADRTAMHERVDAEEEQTAKEIVRELLTHMGIDADVVAVDNPSSMPLDDEDPPTIFVDIIG